MSEEIGKQRQTPRTLSRRHWRTDEVKDPPGSGHFASWERSTGES